MQGVVATVIRGSNAAAGSENYGKLYNNAAAAYQLALRMISGDTAFADKAVKILDAWAGTLVDIDGTSDRLLVSGCMGISWRTQQSYSARMTGGRVPALMLSSR